VVEQKRENIWNMCFGVVNKNKTNKTRALLYRNTHYRLTAHATIGRACSLVAQEADVLEHIGLGTQTNTTNKQTLMMCHPPNASKQLAFE
jgi:hypothetical protein